MYADFSQAPAALKEQLLAFMDAHIYPNEANYHEQLNALPDRFATVPLMDRERNSPNAPLISARLLRSSFTN